MKILVACEESQAVTKELRRLGHEAYSCDIIDQSGGHPEWHIMHDVLPLLDGNCVFNTTDGAAHAIAGKWDMIIAFPPCTHLAVSGALHFEKKRANGDQRWGIDFFGKFLTADCDRISIENLVGIISGDYIPQWFPDLAEKYHLPQKPTQIIHPWMFGDNFSKSTCLWLKGLKPLMPEVTEEPPLEWKEWTGKDGRRKRQPLWFYETLTNCKTAEDRAKARSKTFPGIARAMAEQWAGTCETVSTFGGAEDAPKTQTTEETMELKNIEEQTTIKENTPADFCAAVQLKRLAEERKALAKLRPEEPRFTDDVRALEYAVNVLEAVGL